MALKLTILIPGFADGGAQRQCILLLNELQSDPDFDLQLIHFYDGVHAHLLRHDALKSTMFDSHSNYNPKNMYLAWQHLRQSRPDILMTWLHACDVYGYVLKRAMPSLTWVMTERDSAYPNEIRYNLRRRLGRHADLIVANSEKGAAYWRAAEATGDIFTVPNIVSIDGKPVSFLPAQPRLAMIGRLEPQKNTRSVVEAFGLLAKADPALSLAIVGTGSEEEPLKALAARQGAADRITFLGFRKDVPDQLAAATLVVSMSHHEGLPNVLLETVAAGRLAVVSDIPEHRDLFGPDYPYYVADRNDPQAIATAITRALDCPTELELLDHARASIATMTPQIVAQRYKQIILKAVDARR